MIHIQSRDHKEESMIVGWTRIVKAVPLCVCVCIYAWFYVFLRFSESLTQVRVWVRGFGCGQVWVRASFW